jgi:hypothetical protein
MDTIKYLGVWGEADVVQVIQIEVLLGYNVREVRFVEAHSIEEGSVRALLPNTITREVRKAHDCIGGEHAVRLFLVGEGRLHVRQSHR